MRTSKARNELSGVRGAAPGARGNVPIEVTSTSDRILSTAAKLFRQKGYAATSTRELAATLGIQKASLYYHITGKEDLLHELCKTSLMHILDKTARVVERETDPLLRLRAVISEHVTSMLEDRDMHATMLSELRNLTGERRAEIVRLRDQYETFVRDIIAEGQLDGRISADTDARYLALALLNLLNGTIFWYEPKGPLTPVQFADIFTRVFMNGTVVPRPATSTNGSDDQRPAQLT